MLLDGRYLVAPILRFGLDDANRLLVDEKNIVDRTDISLILADGDPEARTEVNLCLILNDPAGVKQHPVDLVPGGLFGCLVGTPHSVYPLCLCPQRMVLVPCLRHLLLVMCAHPFAEEVLTLHLARSKGHERYFGCNLMHCKASASSLPTLNPNRK